MIAEFPKKKKKIGNDYFQAEEKKHTLTSKILQQPKKRKWLDKNGLLIQADLVKSKL